MSWPSLTAATRRAAAAAAALLLWTGPALACPACFATSPPRVFEAYLASAALLSFLPLAMLGALAGWLYAHSKRRDE